MGVVMGELEVEVQTETNLVAAVAQEDTAVLAEGAVLALARLLVGQAVLAEVTLV